MALPDLEARGIQIVVTQLDVRFKLPATARDKLLVETEVIEVRRASSRWGQRVLREEDGAVLVTAEVVAGVCDTNGKPMRPPADLMEALATLDRPSEA